MSYGGNQPPGYPPQGYQPPGYPPPSYPQPGGYQPGGYGYAPAPQYASFGKRFVAVLLDGLIGLIAQIPGWIVFGIAVAVGASNADAQGRVHDSEAGIFLLLFFLGYALVGIGALAFAIYNIYLLGKTGSTLGKRWMKIKVLDQTGQPLGFWKALGREFVKGLIAVAVSCLIGFVLLLWPLWDKEKQGLYDKVFNTHVYEG